MTKEIVGAIEAAEKKLGFRIPEGVWLDVLHCSYQKLTHIKKPVDYLPILFQNELTDYYARLEINLKGVVNHVQRMLAKPLSSTVS
jgi:hypothetical protein